MDFAALVLMEVDKDNKFIKEVGSYGVGDGAEYVSKFYLKNDKNRVNLYFDTHKDVEDWEFSAIYDYFNKEAFEEKGYEIEEKDDEYNPAWILKFDFNEDHNTMVQTLIEVCELIKSEMEKAFNESQNNKEEYL